MFTLNIRDITRQLEAAERQLDNVEPLLNDVGVYLMGEVRLNFEDLSRGQAGIDGKRWDPLKPETEWKKAKRNRKGPKSKANSTTGNPPKSQIGVDTGMLRNSILPGSPASVFEVDKADLSVTVGFGRSYAKYFDADRPLIPDPTPKEWVEGAEEIALDWIEDQLSDLEG